jgi:hypothetical protein
LTFSAFSAAECTSETESESLILRALELEGWAFCFLLAFDSLAHFLAAFHPILGGEVAIEGGVER